MQNLGDLLKTEREKRGIRLADIASVTKIQLHHLKFIEAGDWKSLPAKPFVKGFLSAYARYVGLNPQEIYQLYLAETQQNLPANEASAPEARVEERIAPTPIRSETKVLQLKPIMLSGLGGLVILFAFWIIRLGKEVSTPIEENAPAVAVMENEPSVAAQAEAPITPPTSESPVAEVPPTPPTTEPAREVANAPAPVKPQETPAVGEGHRLEVTSKERSWVKIVIDEAPPVEYYLKPDEKAEYTAKEKIKLVLGNASAAEVIHNGKVEEGAKYQGTIRYYIFPKGSRFPQDKPRQTASSGSISDNSFPSEKLPNLPEE